MEEDGWELDGNVFVRDDGHYLPLYEAKLFHQYDHRFATYNGVSEKDIRNGNARAMTANDKSDSDAVAIPRYWVPEEAVAERLDKADVTTRDILSEPSRAEPSRAEPSRAEPSRAEPSRAEPSEPSRAEPSRAEPSHYTQDARRDRAQFALRKISGATNERTGIFAMIPVCGLGDSGITIIVGSSHSGTLQAQQTKEQQSLRPYGERP